MRIALMNFNRSGLFHYAASLASALAEIGEHILFITSKYNDLSLVRKHPLLEIYAIDAPHQKYIPFLFKTLNIAQHARLKRKITEWQPDYILINDVYPWYLLYGSFLKKWPVIFIQHDPVIHEGEPKTKFIRIVQKNLCGISEKIIQHSETLPHGNFDLFRKFSSQKQPEKNTVLYFGRILPYKGLDLLIRAIENIADLKLIIAGEGEISPYERLMRHKERYEIHNRYIPEAEIPSFFERAQIVVLPYRSATQTGVIPLAYTFSRPVIATRVGLLPSMVEDGKTGFLIPPNEEKALENMLRKIFQNPEILSPMRTMARKFASEKLSWARIAKEYLKILPGYRK